MGTTVWAGVLSNGYVMPLSRAFCPDVASQCQGAGDRNPASPCGNDNELRTDGHLIVYVSAICVASGACVTGGVGRTGGVMVD